MVVENPDTTIGVRLLPRASNDLQGADARPQSHGELVRSF
jgi:hypothetical protein